MGLQPSGGGFGAGCPALRGLEKASVFHDVLAGFLFCAFCCSGEGAEPGLGGGPEGGSQQC